MYKKILVPHAGTPAGDKALKQAIDILKVRYAKGEITKEEFDRIKEDLE